MRVMITKNAENAYTVGFFAGWEGGVANFSPSRRRPLAAAAQIFGFF